jgi:hypothetical protein
VSVFGPAPFGVHSAGRGPTPVAARGPAPLAATVADRRGDARLALVVLAAALAGIYAISAVTVAGRAPATAAVLMAVAALEASWLVWARHLSRAALSVGMGLDLLLVALWVLSRVRGLPVGGHGPQPVGVVDALCALDAAALASLSWTLGGPGGRRLEPFGAPLSHVAILLAAVSLAVLVGGHTHTARAAGPASPHVQSHAFYCRLL